MFNEYVDYFNEKERMGMVYLKSGLMFVVPPSQASKKFFNEEHGANLITKPYLVGVFVDQQAAKQQMEKFQDNRYKQ
jgi:hypothetical protein